jgi:ABC-2 type transport system permease protein
MFKSLEEILVSPMSYNKIIIWYCLAWVARWAMVWFLVFLFSSFFVDITVFSYFHLFLFIILTSIVFSLAGLLNWIFARNFDDVNIIPSFIITPLIYLWWVFYSISMLSPFWQEVSKFNPVLYMINGLRYAFIWESDVKINISIIILLIFLIILYIWVFSLMKRGKGIKN